MPSESAFKSIVKADPLTAHDPFLKYDSLEELYEVERICDAFSCFKDKNGKHPCITANFAVANPSFERIDPLAGTYYYETFFDTYNSYFGSGDKMLSIIKKAADNHLFFPQLHAREHLNVERWMNDLRNNRTDTVLAFDHRTMGVGSSFTQGNRFGYMDAYNYDQEDELNKLKDIIFDASSLFYKYFGFHARTTAAPCYVWTAEIEKFFAEIGIELIQTQFKQNICNCVGTEKMHSRIHYTGQKNKLKQLYSVRNCSFEPAITQSVNRSIDDCLCQIDMSFKNHKPAIINSHRLNYISSIDVKNGDDGIKGLTSLLKEVTTKYSDIEFFTSEELLELMKS